jgi:hypothetical protein
MRIYLTHCSKDKSVAAKESGIKLPPDQLYTDEGLVTFMECCKSTGVTWAVLSDRFGVFLPTDQHEYYEKHPGTVTDEEETQIRLDLEQKLVGYQEIWFYIRPATIHPFYERVLRASALQQRLTFFSDLSQVQ